ncbi:hypothetical protein Tco_1104191 [Tanacetum coccineum]
MKVWIKLMIGNKPDIDQIDIDDLYNNLRVYEDEMKRSSSSTSNSQNLAILSSKNTSNTNEVSTASGNFGVNTAGGTSLTSQGSSTTGADEVVSPVAQDGLGGYDWSNDFDEPVNYALMAISSSSSSSSSDNEVQNCSKQCLESFKILQKNFDSERELSRSQIRISGLWS